MTVDATLRLKKVYLCGSWISVCPDSIDSRPASHLTVAQYKSISIKSKWERSCLHTKKTIVCVGLRRSLWCNLWYNYTAVVCFNYVSPSSHLCMYSSTWYSNSMLGSDVAPVHFSLSFRIIVCPVWVTSGRLTVRTKLIRENTLHMLYQD